MVAYRPDIDGLRAVAIVSVVAFHTNQAYLPGGFTGVDIFFVISGYLISRIILADIGLGDFRLSHFWIRRARRILPALLFMLLSVTLIALVILLPDDLNQYGQLLSHTVFFAANIFLANEKGYFDPAGLDSPLLHVWSLAVEEQYYLIWPPILVISMQFLKQRYLFGGIVLLLCFSLVYSEWASINAPKTAFYSLASRAFELLTGAALAAIGGREIKPAVLREPLSICGVLLVCSGFFLIDDTSRFPGISALLPCIGAALLILSGGHSTKTAVEGLLSSGIFVRIGKISYSWYLWHWPPLALFRYYYERSLSGVEIAVALAIGLGMAIVSWRFVESPFRRPAALEFKRVLLPVAICSSLVLVALGTAFQSLDGLPSRISKDALAMFNQFEKSPSLGCDGIGQEKTYRTECLFGDPAAAGVSMLLWGDSHAGHYLPAIARIAAAQGVRGVAHISDSCRPFIASEAKDTSRGKRGPCRKSNEETFAQLIARRDISVVLLAARWSARNVESGALNELAVFNENLEKTIAALEQSGKKVIVLGQVPMLRLDLKNCMTKQVYYKIKIPDCEAVSFSLLSSYETSIWEIMRGLSRKHREATFFAPEDHLCKNGVCRGTDVQGVPLYRDDDHLSVRGAHFLEPYMSAAFAQSVRSSLPHIVHSTHP